MPATKYKSRASQFGYTHLHGLHLSIGTCLLAGPGDSERSCGCGLIDADGTFLAEVALHLWGKHRKDVVKEHGKLPFAPFGSYVFDGIELPRPSATWTDTERGTFAILVEEVELAREAP